MNITNLRTNLLFCTPYTRPLRPQSNAVMVIDHSNPRSLEKQGKKGRRAREINRTSELASRLLSFIPFRRGESLQIPVRPWHQHHETYAGHRHNGTHTVPRRSRYLKVFWKVEAFVPSFFLSFFSPSVRPSVHPLLRSVVLAL